jgi:hypothetical protein
MLYLTVAPAIDWPPKDRKGHRLDPVQGGRAKRMDRREYLGCTRRIAGMAPDDAGHLLEVEMFREWRGRGNGQEREEAVQFRRRRGHEVAVPTDGRRLIEPVERRASHYRRDRVRPKPE